VQVRPERPDGWWISPAIPTIANIALAAFWAFSTVGDWGYEAFCGAHRDPGCAARLDHAVLLSLVPATLATVIALAAWSLPRVRHAADRLDGLLTASAFLWVAAEAILFVGGYLAQS
jgi:hypothetical protein